MSLRTGATGRRYRMSGRGAGRFRFPRQRLSPEEVAGRVQSDLAVDLPDEDIGEDLVDGLDLYVMGSKPRCEEAEYLELMEDAIERIARES